MGELKSLAMSPDADWLTQMDEVMDFLELNDQPKMRLVFTKYLRV